MTGSMMRCDMHPVWLVKQAKFYNFYIYGNWLGVYNIIATHICGKCDHVITHSTVLWLAVYHGIFMHKNFSDDELRLHQWFHKGL